jgi:hypothetical protein
MATNATARTRQDRWADWAVIGVLIVALLLGWALMLVVQGQRATFVDAGTGLTLRYPKGWMQKSDDRLLFQAADPSSGEFKTAYQVRVQPIDASGSVTSTLAAALNRASLARAQEGTAYRMLDLKEGKAVNRRPTMEATYVYVVDSVDFFSQQLPVVVMGLDIAVAEGDQAYLFSLLASKDSFPEAERAFRRFVAWAELQ